MTQGTGAERSGTRCARTRSLRSRARSALLLVGLLAFSVGCGRAEDVPFAQAGAAWPGLSAAELSEFEAGRALFDRQFTPEEGLGPTFNDRRCSSCHDLPVIGGFGRDPVRKATRFENGVCDLLVEDGGDLFQTSVTPALRALGIDAEPISPRANAIASITAPALFGLGAIEAIPDSVIAQRADPDDRNGDGISGRTGRSFDGRLGRFGRKATFATLSSFVESALSGEMGLTSHAFPEELGVGRQPLPAGVDLAAEPEVDSAAIARLTNFIRLLAVAAPDTVATRATVARDTVLSGQRLFHQIGCAACHVSRLNTGPNPVSALNRRAVPLYSDLLLHDLGPGLASVCAPDAGPSEWRTTPLMGLARRHRFLHDGRATRIEAAIAAHGGEGQASQQHFLMLSPADQSRLLRFLQTL